LSVRAQLCQFHYFSTTPCVYIRPYSIFRPPHFFHARLYIDLRGASHFPTTPHLLSARKTTIPQREAIFLFPLLGPVLLSSCLGCLLARCSVLVFRFFCSARTNDTTVPSTCTIRGSHASHALHSMIYTCPQNL
jgi:hypothetical protein